jgi:hypothetical protein
MYSMTDTRCGIGSVGGNKLQQSPEERTNLFIVIRKDLLQLDCVVAPECERYSWSRRSRCILQQQTRFRCETI